MTDNLTLWAALAKTDPKHTKSFSRSGGFKGTALKPIWIIRLLTAQFGPCGQGWGINKPDHEYVPVGDGEVLVFCTVSVWHGTKDNVLWGVGGDKAVTRRNDGKLFVDDEAAKKAFTDAVNNAFKFIGVGGDIHMGLFEDDKYVTATKLAFEDDDKAPSITDAQYAELVTLSQQAEVDLGAFLKAFGIVNLQALPETEYEAIRDRWQARLLKLTSDQRKAA